MKPKPEILLLALLLLPLSRAGADPAGNLRSGFALCATGQYARAGSAFTQVLAEDPRCAEARVGCGVVLLRQNQPEAALREFEQATVLDSALAAAHLGRAAALLALDRWSEADAEYSQLYGQGAGLARSICAARAWLRCQSGDYESALQLAGEAQGLSASRSLATYVAQASDFALHPASARPAPPAVPGSAGSVGLGSCLTSPGASWTSATPLVVVSAPALQATLGANGGPGRLDILLPRPGATVRGRVPVSVRLVAAEGSQVACLLATVGGSFAGMSEGSAFAEPLDATTWPPGHQDLVVEALDATGRRLARGETSLYVETGQLTWAEQPRRSDPWVERQMEHLLTPDLLPGVWEQFAGQVAWYQRRLPEAQRQLTDAFCIDPQLPRVREELLTVCQALGLPVLRPVTAVTRTSSRRSIALTFDDGPHPRVTPWVLDQLDKAGAHATFLLVGKQVEMYPELAREIVARGHEVGSHSFSHVDLTSVTPVDVERELVSSRAVLAAATGVQVTLFRPPGGNYDARVARAAGLWGFTPVFWTCNVCDYYRNQKGRAVSGMLEHTSPGGIVLLHNGEDLTTEILPEYLQSLRASGYNLCSVSELLAARN